MPSEPLKPIADWGLNHDPAYIVKRWKYHRKSGRYPNHKSYEEQTKALLDDFETLDFMTQWWMEKLEGEKGPSG